MMNEMRTAFNSSFIIPHSSFLLQLSAGAVGSVLEAASATGGGGEVGGAGAFGLGLRLGGLRALRGRGLGFGLGRVRGGRHLHHRVVVREQVAAHGVAYLLGRD